MGLRAAQVCPARSTRARWRVPSMIRAPRRTATQAVPPAYAADDAESRPVGWLGTPRVGGTPPGVSTGIRWLAQPSCG